MARTNALNIKAFAVMAALTKATGEGRVRAFLDDATEETRDAILNEAKRNLDRLMKGKAPAKSKSTKAPAKKVSKVKTTKKVATKAPRKAANAKSIKTDDRIVTKTNRIAAKIADKVIRMRNRFDGDNLTAEKKKVARLLQTNGAEFVGMNRNFSITMRVSGTKMKVLFRAKGPVVKQLEAA